jgi:hypothetical protein
MDAAHLEVCFGGHACYPVMALLQLLNALPGAGWAVTCSQFARV